MSLGQFADRIGVAAASTVHDLERGEAEGTVTINRLRAAADALGCDLVVAVVPRESLESRVRDEARRVVAERARRVNHSMALEAQTVGEAELREMLRRAEDDVVARGGRHLWG